MTSGQDPAESLELLRRAFLSGDARAIADRFTPDAVLHSPAFAAPFRGREELTKRLLAVGQTLEDVRYTGAFQEGPEVVWRFSATVNGREIEGVDIFRLDDEGRISELTVLLRPLSGLAGLIPIGSRFAGAHGPRGFLLRILRGPLTLLARMVEEVMTRLTLGRDER